MEMAMKITETMVCKNCTALYYLNASPSLYQLLKIATTLCKKFQLKKKVSTTMNQQKHLINTYGMSDRR